ATRRLRADAIVTNLAAIFLVMIILLLWFCCVSSGPASLRGRLRALASVPILLPDRRAAPVVRSLWESAFGGSIELSSKVASRRCRRRRCSRTPRDRIAGG